MAMGISMHCRTLGSSLNVHCDNLPVHRGEVVHNVVYCSFVLFTRLCILLSAAIGLT
jgi:hypothetical protein